MISIEKILKRSWHILWNYRVLWIFGILLAITMGGGSSGSNGGGNSGYRVNESSPSTPSYEKAPEWAREFLQWLEQDVEPLFLHPGQNITTWIWVGIAFFLFILIVSMIVAMIRYPSETAVMRMVDEYEQTGTKLGFREGWRLGWSRRAFRLWLIDVILALPAFAFLALSLIIGLIVYFFTTRTPVAPNIFGSVAAIGIFFIGLFIFIVAMVFLSLLRNFFARAAALENLGVIESLRGGWAMFKNNWKSAGLMWLVMVGIGIGYAFAGIILFFILIPAYVIMLLPALVAASLPGLLAFGIVSLLFSSVPVAIIIAAVIALPIFFIVLFSPLLVASGWYRVYTSTVWTLTYREIKALANLATPALTTGAENL